MNPFVYIYVCIGICERRKEERAPATPAVGCRWCRAEPQGGGVGDRRRSYPGLSRPPYLLVLQNFPTLFTTVCFCIKMTSFHVLSLYHFYFILLCGCTLFTFVFVL
ncbi:hypothetical protein Hanom_Chr16g01516021 [Helianthus anomalus]